jgi:hypothetical protein
MAAKKIVRQNKRGRGRPIEVGEKGADKAIGIRLPNALLRELDAWAKSNEVSRSEAIRQIVELYLDDLKR